MNKLYAAIPDGYCGDEDNGQTSAWYIFSAMGFYPVAPGQNVYAIGSPEFSKVILHLDRSYYDAEQFVIETVNNSKENKYIQSATLNGNALNKTWFTHEQIKNGRTLVFKMGPEPNKNWGSRPEDSPPSLNAE